MAQPQQNFTLQQPGLGAADFLLPGASLLGGLLQGFGGGAQRDALQSQTRINEAQEQRRRQLQQMILGGQFGQIGSQGISQGQQQQQLGRFQQSLQPQFNRTAANTFSQTGLSSPLSQKLLAGSINPLIAGRAGQLQQQSTQLGSQRDQFLASLLRGL